MNLFNLTDKHALTGVSGVQNNALATKGANGGTINGSAPTYFVGQGVSGLISFSTGF